MKAFQAGRAFNLVNTIEGQFPELEVSGFEVSEYHWSGELTVRVTLRDPKRELSQTVAGQVVTK